MTRSELVVQLSHKAASMFEVDFEELTAPTRQRGPVIARRWVWLQLHDVHGWSFPEIGKAMKRDHSTVVHGVQVARKENRAQ